MHNREWYSCWQRLLFALHDIERFSFDFEMVTHQSQTKLKQQTDNNIKLDWLTKQKLTRADFGWFRARTHNTHSHLKKDYQM